jgi:hypothetical protein
MHNIALVVVLAAGMSVVARTPASYRVTHTYTLGGETVGTTSCRTHPTTGCSLPGRIA